jgi:hypothetical protein
MERICLLLINDGDEDVDATFEFAVWDLVHPEAVEAMKEVGIDLSTAKPQKLTPELAQDAYLLVTMGCGDEYPFVPGLRRDDWPLPDPKGKTLALSVRLGFVSGYSRDLRPGTNGIRRNRAAGDACRTDRKCCSLLIAD